MPDKIATAEDVQAELRTLVAMTQSETPSRAKLAAALTNLASRVAGDPTSDYDVKDLKKSIEILKEIRKDLAKVLDKEGGIPDALIHHSYLVKRSPVAAKLDKLLEQWHINRGMAEVRLGELIEALERLLKSIPG